MILLISNAGIGGGGGGASPSFGAGRIGGIWGTSMPKCLARTSPEEAAEIRHEGAGKKVLAPILYFFMSQAKVSITVQTAIFREL
jgi:hypothetical protein